MAGQILVKPKVTLSQNPSFVTWNRLLTSLSLVPHLYKEANNRTCQVGLLCVQCVAFEALGLCLPDRRHPQLLALGILVGDVTGLRVHLAAELRVTMQDPTQVQLLFWSLCHCDMSSHWLGG